MSSMAEDTRWLDATAQAALVHAGEATPAELVEAAIERIEAGNPALNAVVTETFDRAREAAASAALPDGPFRGVPFLVKDLWALTEGDRCTNGVLALAPAGWRAPIDTTLVGRHRAAGLVILGRTNTPELGILPTTEPMAFGPTHNPWDLDRSPGGSSGGSAAAVAAGLVPAAHASDGGGSIRIPASCCGLVGLKVSQGRTTLGPLRDESGLGVEHVVTRSVRDAAALLDATCGPGVGDTVIAPAPIRPYLAEVGADPGRLRIGFLSASTRVPTHPACVRAVELAAALLESLGHHVEAAHPDAPGGRGPRHPVHRALGGQHPPRRAGGRAVAGPAAGARGRRAADVGAVRAGGGHHRRRLPREPGRRQSLPAPGAAVVAPDELRRRRGTSC